MLPFSALVLAIENAIEKKLNGEFIDPWVAHNRIKKMYSWSNVARRTEQVAYQNNDLKVDLHTPSIGGVAPGFTD